MIGPLPGGGPSWIIGPLPGGIWGTATARAADMVVRRARRVVERIFGGRWFVWVEETRYVK